MITKTTIRHEVAVDREIDGTGQAYVAAIGRTTSAIELLHVAVGDKREGHGLERRWTMSFAETITAATEIGTPQLARYEALVTAQAEALAAYRAADARFMGWSRFYLVTNTGGHIHRAMTCTTCFADTRFAWLTDLSGLSEAAAVEAYGAILCTVCFPSAPSEWTGGVNKVEAAEKAQRAAERQAKAEAKAARATARALTHRYGLRKVRASDGEVFDDREVSYSTPTTLKAAAREAARERTYDFWNSVEVIDLTTGEVVA